MSELSATDEVMLKRLKDLTKLARKKRLLANEADELLLCAGYVIGMAIRKQRDNNDR